MNRLRHLLGWRVVLRHEPQEELPWLLGVRNTNDPGATLRVRSGSIVDIAQVTPAVVRFMRRSWGSWREEAR